MNFWEKFSLKTRLILLYSGLLALIVCILGISFFIDTRNLLIENTASYVRATAKPIIGHWLYGGDRKIFTSAVLKKVAGPLARDLTSRNIAALILNKNGKPIANGKVLSEEPSPPTPNPKYYKQALSGENEIIYVTYNNGHRILVVLIPLRKNPNNKKIIGVAQLSSYLKGIYTILTNHAVYLGLGVFITLLMGFGLGFLLISSALEGLNHVIGTCQEISNGDLSKRVNLPKRGDEIGRLAYVFDEMIDRIESVFKAQSRFVANAAHELRTPLTVLQGSIEVLLMGSHNHPDAVNSLSKGMLKETKRLNQLCERLLDIARLEGPLQIQKRKLNLSVFFDEFVLETKTFVGSRRVIIKKGPHVVVLVDRDVLKQIFFNLLHNSVQYTKDKGIIMLEWELAPHEVKISISDDGCGIPSSDISHIFEPFYRGKQNIWRKERGTGLGLTLVKSMVEAHNGRIYVKSEENVGTTFVFTLPLV